MEQKYLPYSLTQALVEVEMKIMETRLNHPVPITFDDDVSNRLREWEEYRVMIVKQIAESVGLTVTDNPSKINRF